MGKISTAKIAKLLGINLKERAKSIEISTDIHVF
jgi:hypothetical protein